VIQDPLLLHLCHELLRQVMRIGTEVSRMCYLHIKRPLGGCGQEVKRPPCNMHEDSCGSLQHLINLVANISVSDYPDWAAQHRLCSSCNNMMPPTRSSILSLQLFVKPIILRRFSQSILKIGRNPLCLLTSLVHLLAVVFYSSTILLHVPL
jgi:hypothetical protein